MARFKKGGHASPKRGSYAGERCEVISECEFCVILRHPDRSTHSYHPLQLVAVA